MKWNEFFNNKKAIIGTSVLLVGLAITTTVAAIAANISSGDILPGKKNPVSEASAEAFTSDDAKEVASGNIDTSEILTSQESDQTNTLDNESESTLPETGSEPQTSPLETEMTSDEETQTVTETEPDTEESSDLESETETESKTETEPEIETTTKPEQSEDVQKAESVLASYTKLGVVSDVNNYLNVRNMASTDGEVIGKVLKNGGVNIIEDCENGWYKIDFAYSDDGIGYVNSDYILVGKEAEAIAVENAMLMVTVDAECLNVREKPTTESDVLTQITALEKYQVVEDGEEWVGISMGTDENGNESVAYVSKDFVTLGYDIPSAIPYENPEPEQNPLRTELVNFAVQYLGGAYVWGGTTLGVGVDCSGFTQQVFANFGIALNRCSYEQAEQGMIVTPETMKPGDLIFYSRPGYEIGHVGIYIGNGQVIHAYNASQGIIITAYNYATPIRITNVIGD